VAIGLTGAGTTTATYNGVAMQSLGVINSDNQTAGYAQLFGLVNPATGANTVAISTTLASITGGSMSFTNAIGFGTAVTSFGNSAAPSCAVTGTHAGNMVADVVCNGSAITSGTQKWLLNNNVDTAAGNGAGSAVAAGGTVTMGYTVTSDWWGMVAVEILGMPPRPIAIRSQAVMRASLR